MITTAPRAWTIILAGLILAAPLAGARPGYLFSPDIHGNQIIFTAEGDLWIADLDGAAARQVHRLTSHPGHESLARFSPDGGRIAFTGEYDGNADIYVMPVTGGEPRRMTWHPGADRMVDWTSDGERIIFRGYRTDPIGNAELYTLPAGGGEPEKMPLGRANMISIDPESGRWAFTRNWGGGTWKRYRGGTAPDIWVGDPDRDDFAVVTDFDGPDAFPMWHGGRIYFLSDMGGTANIWSMAPDGSDRRRHTQRKKWDARWPAMAPDGRIVFMLAGDLHLFDPASGSEQALDIDLPSERSLTRTRYPRPARYLTEYTLAPEGDRVAVVARGEVFSIPVEEGVTLPVTRTSGAREKMISYDHQGERLLYVTDESGEEAIVTADAWGRGDLREVKAAEPGGEHRRPRLSPDGKWVAYGDVTHHLYLVAADGGQPRVIDHCDRSRISDYAWSPDGRWLAYSKNNDIAWASIHIYDTQEEEIHQVTDWTTDDYGPAWDPDGRYLYFLSERSIDPLIGRRDFETILVESTLPCALLLRPDVENPLRSLAGVPPTEEEEEPAEKEEEAADGEDEDEDRLDPVEIEFDGLSDRAIELPVPGGLYRNLAATTERLFYLAAPVTGLAGDDDLFGDGPRSRLMAFKLEDQEAETFLEGVAGYVLQAGCEKLLVAKDRGELYVVGAGSPPPDLTDAAVDLSGIVLSLDPREEWRQIYNEAWRMMRAHYWDEEMHGLDWEAIRDQYATLLPRIATRQDLGDILAEVAGELSTSHTYVFGGDNPGGATRRATGLLGAVLEREQDAFRVARILRGGDADGVRAPLDEPGVDIDEGDYILAVNHRPVPDDLPFEALFDNLAGRQVLLTVNDRATHKDAREVVVTPIGSEAELLYADWVRRNREYVAAESDGKIGYIHIPDMGGRGLTAFNRWFYPQLDREGMVVDVRWNGGGFVSQLILARLEREIISWDRVRWGGVTPYPMRVLNGPFVVLVNEGAGSDGDIFPEAVQLAGAAPVIGTRSWGGVVGIYGFRRLIDGGGVSHPESAWWDRRRGWGLEGRGVEPDILVVNLPQELALGIDAQLDRGIREVLRLHKRHPPLEPEFGPGPDRSRKAYRNER